MNSTWRARRFSVDLNRRHRVTITVRRFRRAGRVSRPGSQQLLLNVHVAGVRQLCLEHKRLGRARKPQRLSHRRQTAVAAMLILLGLSGITFSAAALAKPTNLQPVKPATAATNKPAPKQAVQPVVLTKSEPTNITIASQNIDTGLIPVGLNADGSIELPPVLEAIAGWYKYGPTPGELGPAVIVGHVDNYETVSVFWRLRYVQAGDIIDVTRQNGSTARFQVTRLAQYDQNSFPTDEVYGNTQDAELRVITCGGTFDTATQHYTQNTVVYATLAT